MKILDIQQGSHYWKKWRKQGIGASEAATITGENPYSSKQEWLQTAVGLRNWKGNARTKRGERLEPYVRKLASLKLGIEFRPVCTEHDDYSWLRASLDGLSMDNKVILEIKCPNDIAHMKALSGGVPSYYYPQLQHQFLVTELKKSYYVSYSDEKRFAGDQLAIVEIEPNPTYMDYLFDKLEEANRLREKALALVKNKVKKVRG